MDSIFFASSREGCEKLLALVDACGNSKRQVIALLDQVFPEYDRLFLDALYPTLENLVSAIGAVSRKLCSIIFATLSENRPYESVPSQCIRHDSAYSTM